MSFLKKLFGKGDPWAKLGDRLSAEPDLPHPFGYKTAWFALSTSDTAKAAGAFGLQNIIPSNWKSGVDTVYSYRLDNAFSPVFVTPPLNGWTLVLTDLVFGADTEKSITSLENILTSLSREFGECQHFGSYRVVDYAAWYRAQVGTIIRGFSFVGSEGEFLVNSGDMTEIERALGFPDLSGQAANQLAEQFWQAEERGEDVRWPNEEDPALIAGAWSINPLDLPGRYQTPGTGLLGHL